MAKKLVCNVESQGMMHQVTVSGNKVTVDGNAPMKIKDLPKEKRKSGAAITIPLSQMDSCILYRSSFTGDSLVHNGIDCKTGQPFVEEVMPKWIWVFWAIYIADFFLFLGGALGGAINAAAAVVTGSIAMKKNTDTGVKVILCIVFCVIVTLVEIMGAYAIINAIQLSIISVVFCHREPLFFMPKNFKNITKNS